MVLWKRSLFDEQHRLRSNNKEKIFHRVVDLRSNNKEEIFHRVVDIARFIDGPNGNIILEFVFM